MKRSNSDDFLMTAIIMAEAHGNCRSDNALYKNGLLLLLLLLRNAHKNNAIHRGLFYLTFVFQISQKQTQKFD